MGLKIAMIMPWMRKCGIYTYGLDLSNALASLGHEVYVVNLIRFGLKSEETMENLARKVPVDEVDVIHMQHEYGLTQELDLPFYRELKRQGLPIVSTMHAVGDHKRDSVVSEFSDSVIVHNKFCKRIYGFPSVIIPHGCNLFETIPMDEAKISMGVEPNVPIVGYCGFISSAKGLENLVEAMRKVKAGLIIGGGWHAGPDTQYIGLLRQKSMEYLEGRCQWIGYVKDEELNKVYSALDVVVYPSRYATESGALLMALAHQKAVISSNIRPFREKEKVGALTTFKNVKNLRYKIKRLLKNDEQRIKLEEGARRYCIENSWENVAKMHVAKYEKVLEK